MAQRNRLLGAENKLMVAKRRVKLRAAGEGDGEVKSPAANKSVREVIAHALGV